MGFVQFDLNAQRGIGGPQQRSHALQNEILVAVDVDLNVLRRGHTIGGDQRVNPDGILEFYNLIIR